MKDLYISVAARPGKFGATVYNELFSRRGINAVYEPRVAPATAAGLFRLLEEEKVRGCSVSMPLKSAVVPGLDWAEEAVSLTGSCNTIVMKAGKKLGFNTDLQGLELALRQLPPARRVLVHGYGAVVNSLVHALKKRGAGEIILVGRRAEAAAAKAAELGISSGAAPGSFELLVNATPLEEEAAAREALYPLLEKAEAAFDLLVRPVPTPFLARAAALGKPAVAGLTMAMGQLQEQFFHYFGSRPELAEIEAIVRERYR